jgi:hypothetical protein
MRAIAVENLSKSYVIGRRYAWGESYTTLRDVLAREARNFARKGLITHDKDVRDWS